MRNAKLLLMGISLFSCCWLQGQDLSRKVSLHYQNERLGVVLNDISRDYNVRFTYSSDFIPLNHPVSIAVEDQELSAALDDLCAQAPVQYRSMSGYVVLKANERKQELSQLQKPLPKSVPQTSPIYPSKQTAPVITREKKPAPAPLNTKKMEQLPGGNELKELNFKAYDFPVIEQEPEGNKFGDTRLAQISLMPFLGTNLLRSAEVTNNVSVNVLWGTNGGVDGFEVGGFVNTIINDVNGVQVAGLGNTVGGEMIGTQVGGLFNATRGKTQGVQVAGLFNLSGEKADAVQASGLFNVSRGDFAGVQAAGLYNTSWGAADGLQVSGLFNTSRGKTKTQISGLFNTAGDVGWGQISGLMNVGKKVNGFQIGLINVSDTISGIPIGLLNIVKKGYNRVEFAGSEGLFANFSLKLGAKSFYNIFHLGARWDDITKTENGAQVTDSYTTWGLGYGIGTAITLGRHSLMNIEAVAIHVNEMEPWTRELNLLNQFRILFDVRIGRRTSLFAGPVGNLMVSRYFNADTNTYGSIIAPKALYDETTNGTNVKMWVGFQAGIRF